MKIKLLSFLLGSTLGIMAAVYGHNQSKPIEVTSGEPFTEEQILAYQAEVNIPRQTTKTKSNSKEEYTTIVPVSKPTYVYLDIPLSEDLQKFAQEKCRYYKIGYAFFLAMCESESSFIWPNTTDNIGYMQINLVNEDRYPELNIYEEYDNLEVGIRMMAELKDAYMSFDEIIMGYKGGEASMLEWVAEGYRLSICDQILERTNYYQELIEEVKQ